MPGGDRPGASWGKDAGACGQRGQTSGRRGAGSSTGWDTAGSGQAGVREALSQGETYPGEAAAHFTPPNLVYGRKWMLCWAPHESLGSQYESEPPITPAPVEPVLGCRTRLAYAGRPVLVLA